MTQIYDLPTPALLLDVDRLDANLDWMAARAAALGVGLRPHVKTHKCIEVGRRQRARGATGITVSTLYEAKAFADRGFDDITWAFPVIPSRIPDVVALASRIRFGVVVDAMHTADALADTGASLDVWLKVDCGYHRAGVDPEHAEAMELARRLADAPTLQFRGILSHSGHAYDTPSRDAAAAIAESERRVMTTFATRLEDNGIEVPDVSVGSTPSMRAVRDLSGVTEARPGNYALFDFTQVWLESCTPSECAATVLTTVISAPAGLDHAIADAGALALSKDPGPAVEPATMGEIYDDYAKGRLHERMRVVGVSQEHGKVVGRPPVGARLRVLPNHSCLTVAQFDEFVVVRGAEVVDRWPILRGRG